MIIDTTSSLSAQLLSACETYDLAQARLVAAQLINWLAVPGNSLSDAEARKVIAKIIGNRWFDVAEQIAEPLVDRGDASPVLVRRYAQILMEREHYDEALMLLNSLSETKGLHANELNEVIGHIGRLHKDMFMASLAAGCPDDHRLKLAIEMYLNGYNSSPSNNLWHGINAIAMLALAKRVGSEHALLGNPIELAHNIIETVQLQDETNLVDSYDLATAAEAYVALGDYLNAIAWLKRYLPSADVFALGSTLRQFEQVWGLEDQPYPAPQLLDLLRAEQVVKTNGVVHLQRKDFERGLHLSSGSLEAVFGPDRFDTLDNYRKGLERCACVARIARDDGAGGGTGFLISGRLLSPKLPDLPVLITNSHVVSECEALRAKGALHPSEAFITFTALESQGLPQKFTVAKILFHSPPDELDTVILELSELVTPTHAYPIAPVLPVSGSSAQIRVIGHPSGGTLSISVNCLLDHEAPKIHYRTATEGGSSGSPVFNQSWQLIGLHHAGGDAMQKLNGKQGTYEANEGVWIKSIIDAVGKLTGQQ
jgi:hypothetical protein